MFQNNRILPTDGHFSNVIRVQTRIVFLEVHDIETINERFTAEVYIETEWPLNDTQETILDVEKLNPDWKPKWSPKLKISNVVSESTCKAWYKIIEINEIFYIVEIQRIKGTFYEKLELQNYPFDVQRLNIDLIASQPTNQCLLYKNSANPSVVFIENFRDSQEWFLYNYVGVEENGIVSSKYSINQGDQSNLKMFCVVARKPGYFYWNAFYLIFLISAISFNMFSISTSSYGQRLSSTNTLILTSVSFKWVINRSLPPIAYLTTLDIYSVFTISFMSILTCWHAIIGFFFTGSKAVQIDFIFLIFISSAYIICHIVFIIYLFLNAFGPRRYYSNQEKLYKNEVSTFEKKNQEKIVFQSSDEF